MCLCNKQQQQHVPQVKYHQEQRDQQRTLLSIVLMNISKCANLQFKLSLFELNCDTNINVRDRSNQNV